jgi:hypothetical protein
MTDLPVSPQFPPPPTPPGQPAGRPSVWQAAVIFAALAVVAAGSCAAFLAHPSGSSLSSSNAWGTTFLVSVPLAAGAFTLLVFRLWRRRVAEAWPSVGQAVLMGVAGAILAGGGCGGWTMTVGVSKLLPVGIALFVVFLIGLLLAIGAGELFVVALGRLIFKRPGAR